MNKPCRTCGAQNRYDNGNCRPCTRKRVAKYSAANSEKIKGYKVEYRAANLESIKTYQAEYRATNSGQIKAYRLAHAEKMRKYQQDYRKRKKV